MVGGGGVPETGKGGEVGGDDPGGIDLGKPPWAAGAGRRGRRSATQPELPRKEVIQPHLPVRLPCYDFVPIAGSALDGSLPTKGVRPPASGVSNFHDVTGGVYKARERIHGRVLTGRY